MTNLRRWLGRRIGRRNLPFVAAVIGLAIVVVVLLVYSPHTESGNARRGPTIVSTD